MTKTKKIVALLATLAVGTTAMACISLGVNNADNTLSVYASTNEDETELSSLETGVNTLSLIANVSQTFSINNNNVGIYGFELPYTLSETDGSKIYDEFSATITVSVNGTALTLNSANPYAEIELTAPSSATVVITSNINVNFDLHLTYDYVYTELVIGNNELTLTADNVQNCIIISNVEGEVVPAGYYTFTIVDTTGSANFDFIIDGEIQTYRLNYRNTTFTVYLNSPSTTAIPVYWLVDTTIDFTISYSQTDPNATSNTLAVGTQTVNASGSGNEYTFTSVSGGTYTLNVNSESNNANVLVETNYGADAITAPYTFFISAGGTVTFYMCTNDWNDDTYDITISYVYALGIGTQTVSADAEGVAYTFTATANGNYALKSVNSNAKILVNGTVVTSPYIFTLAENQTITFVMSTNNGNAADYSVAIGYTLVSGEQTVNAGPFGIEYNYYSVSGGTYVLSVNDSNANIQCDDESVVVATTTDEDGNIVSATYTFTLSAGNSVTFAMYTNDWTNGTYNVTLTTL